MSSFVEGVRDLLPTEFRRRKWVYRQLRQVFAGDGYQEVATPTLEAFDLYADTETLFDKERMFKVVDEHGRILVLRPDVTLPIARMVATRYSRTPGPWKFSYITNAYLANRGQSHILKEKTQAGIELLGRSDLLADVEVIGVLIRALQAVGIAKPQIDLGQAALVDEILAQLHLEPAAQLELRILMEEKNTEAIERRIYQWQLGLPEAAILRQFPLLFGLPEEVIAGLCQLPLQEKAQRVVQEMEMIYNHLVSIGYGEYITFDPAMVTHLGYYTGIIFRAYVKGYGEVVASGGRYDQLSQQFGQDTAAVGFAIEIDKLMTCLQRRSLHTSEGEIWVLLQMAGEEEFAPTYQIAEMLRERGALVELFTGQDVAEYGCFHQIPIIGRWEEGSFVITGLNDTAFYFSGSLEEIAAACWAH